MRRWKPGHWLTIVALLLAGDARAGGDLCKPVAILQPHDVLTVDIPSRGATPRVEAILARDVKVRINPASLELAPGDGEKELKHRAVIQRHVFGYGDLVGDRGQVTFDGEKSGQITVRSAKRHLLLRFENGTAVTADGQALEIVPPLFSETWIALPAGARVLYAGPGEVVLRKGTKIVWPFDIGRPLELRLPQAARLEETASDRAVQRLSVLRPLRVSQGGSIDVQVAAPNVDLRTKPLAFCFTAMGGPGSVSVASERVKFVAQSGDVAKFVVEVPDFDAAGERLAVGATRAWDGAGWSLFSRGIGVPVSVRAVGVDGDRLLVDASDRVTISSSRIASIISLVLLGILFALSSIWLRRWNPFAIVGALVRHESGRYSLSNLQTVMWTVLVLFALCFNWITTGELLDISSGILVLLGISGTVSVVTRTIDAQGGANRVPAAPVDSSVKDLVTKDDGSFDLLRFQMLGFTVFTWFYVLISVLRSQGFPEIPESFYALMGISNTAYLGGKLPGMVGEKPKPSPDPAALGPTTYEESLAVADIKRVQTALGVPDTGIIDPKTREAVKHYKLVQGIAPASGSLDRLLIAKIAAQ